MTIKRLSYQNHTDQQLIDSFKKSGNEHALAVLYARYRVSLGNYLLRRLKGSQSVTRVFNALMTQLLIDVNTCRDKSSVATDLFALAYQQYPQGSVHLTAVQIKRVQPASDNTARSGLSELQSELIELVYKINFTPSEAAEIIGISTPEFKHCLTFIANHKQNALDTFKRRRPLCRITKVSHPPAAKQDTLIYTAS